MVAIAFSQRRSTVTKHCGNKRERSCLRRSRPSVAQFNGDRWQATEKATLPLLEGPSEPNVVCCDSTHTGYDDAGRRTQQKATDGSRTSWTYDAASNLTKVQDKKADNSAISSFDYRTDNVGNRTGATLASGVRVTWVYDTSNQLTAERRSGVSAYANTFVYDTVGNRVVLNANGTRTTTVYDSANQIKYSTAAGGRTTYTFDPNGNQQIVREPAGSRTTTIWNFENQPTLFRLPDGSRVTMTYNANNRRIDKE